MVRTLSALKPGSRACTVHRARISRLAEASSTTDAVISTTTSAERSRSLPEPPPERSPSRSPAADALPVARSAGTRLKASPVSAVSATAKPSTRRSIAGPPAIGRAAGTRRASSGTAPHANATPSTPPRAPSSRPSVASWRTMRSRPAPMAARTASSCARARPRPSSRLARLAQAMSSTHSEAPQSATSSSRDWRGSSSRIAITAMPLSPSSAGNCRRWFAATTSMSARALASVAPGLSRPTVCSQLSLRSS